MVLTGFMAWDACLLNMPTVFIMLFRVPPVIFEVSEYLKSAFAGNVPNVKSTHNIAAMKLFIRGPPACINCSSTVSENRISRPGRDAVSDPGTGIGPQFY